MAQTVEPMDVDTSFPGDYNAAEVCQDDENEASYNQLAVSRSRYDNLDGDLVTEIELTEEEQAKMEERAKRFGFQNKLNTSKVEKDKDGMGIAKDINNTKHLGLDVLHTKGTEDVNTKNVLNHIEDYGLTSVELIDDVSCNKGLLSESRKRQYKQVRQPKKRVDNGLSDDENKKRRSKNPWGTLSETWGLNDTVEDTFLRADLTTEQRISVKERLGFKSQAKEVPVKIKQEESSSESDSGSSDEEWCKRSKGLRMRMHADDEEEKMLKKRIKQRTQELRASELSDSTDLRSRLRNSKVKPIYRDTIQIVVTNTTDRVRESRPQTPEVQDSEVAESVQDEVEADEELEEGEWIEASEQIEKPVEDDEEEQESDDSDVSEKEVQGPKGSVIKVVPRVKPRVASTVWARLNNTKQETESKNRFTSQRDLRGTLKGDLRSRLGQQKRGRSPLRIEVRNDKYAEDTSDTE